MPHAPPDLTARAAAGASARGADPVAAAAARQGWIDEARGIGILLVVLGHAWRGLREAGLLPGDRAFEVVDRLIYAFHMPFFFLLAGLVLEGGLRRAAPWAFLRSRVARLLYPLVVWTYVFAAFRAVAGSLANGSSGWTGLLIWPLPPQAHLWFLWALFLIQVAALGLRPALARPGSGAWPWLAALGLSLALRLVPVAPPALAALVGPAIHFAPFVALGALIAGRALPSGPWAAAAAAAAFLAAEAAALAAPRTATLDLLIGAVASLALCGLIAARRRAWPPGRAGRPGVAALLEALGRASLAIFLAHTIFSAALRIALEEAGIASLPLHVVAGTAIGVAGPLLLLRAARRTGTARALGL